MIYCLQNTVYLLSVFVSVHQFNLMAFKLMPLKREFQLQQSVSYIQFLS